MMMPASPRRERTRVANKIYNTPPDPSPNELLCREKSFVLDCNAVSSISKDYSKANPKLGPVCPPYNSQRDPHVSGYFWFCGVDKTLSRTGQVYGGTSIEGQALDRFHDSGAGRRYLVRRNKSGAGHSWDTCDGHAQFLQDVRPIQGWNGPFGYRRNTPWLRKWPSPFGMATNSPLYAEQLGPPEFAKCA